MKDEILKKAKHLAGQIKHKQKELLEILLNTESYETACDEIFRAVDCLGVVPNLVDRCIEAGNSL